MSGSGERSKVTATFILAGDCGACLSLKKSKILDNTVRELESAGVKVKIFNLPSMASQVSGSDSFSSIINRYYHSWFPFIFVSSTALVEKAQRERVDGESFVKSSSVFNGDFVNGQVVQNRIYTKFNASTLLQWIDAYTSSSAYTRSLSIASLNDNVMMKSAVLQKAKATDSQSRDIGHQVTSTVVFENDSSSLTAASKANHNEIEIHSYNNPNFTIVPRNRNYYY